ncbi:MAG: hypothetical protein LUQ11_16365 [Methylococcaceae bacterium]|nr:hypothetical protein [Methylococcaceae bacterium]
MLKASLNSLIWAMTISYPFLVWFSLDYFQPRFVALSLAGLFLLRFVVRGTNQSTGGLWAWLMPAGALFLLAVALVNETSWLLAYPVFVSLAFFAVFSFSLAYPPTVVERLARLDDPKLPPKGVAYTRKVTQVWSAFFLGNAALSLATVCYGDPWLWSLYNGCVSYVLMGLLMAGEMAVRRRVRASY